MFKMFQCIISHCQRRIASLLIQVRNFKLFSGLDKYIQYVSMFLDERFISVVPADIRGILRLSEYRTVIVNN